MNANDMPTKLLWMDLEMTGLDPDKQRIIEVAILVTDFELNEIARYEAVIHQSDDVLANAEQWPQENMQELFEQVRDSQLDEDKVTQDIVDLIEQNFGEERPVLAGNSIHQDRRFIRKWWPNVEAKLHYRMLDVSTLKVWTQGKLGVQYEKDKAHRALGDIKESIEELKWSLQQIKN